MVRFRSVSHHTAGALNSQSHQLSMPVFIQGHSRARAIPQFGPHVLQVRKPLQSLYTDTLVKLGRHVDSLFRGAAAAVIVFDITSKDSFAKAKSWIKELQRQVPHP